MRASHTTASAMIIVGSFAGVVAPAAQADGSRADYNTANGYVNESLSSFKGHKAAHPRPFNWTDDGCSSPWYQKAAAPLDTYLINRKFHDACVRHDFGYRNFGPRSSLKLGKYAPGGYAKARETIDNRFYNDMKAIAGWNPAYKAAAYAYFQAVRHFGDGSF